MMISWTEYLAALASKAPTPGGGGGAAVCGALGTALGEMVANLTIGKKKYVQYEEKNKEIRQRLTQARLDFERLSKEDEEAFAPLSQVYKMKAGTDEEQKKKDEEMERCLRRAAMVPMQVMELSVSLMDDFEFLARNGSRLAVSDAGCGVQMLRAALLSSILNVFSNTKSMKDRTTADEWNKRAKQLKEEGMRHADEIYEIVEKAVGE